eukprot:TRINITY_DN20799_c0_g1_i1.p1 TRINITY_DN20799_c0_g1~~TRINITY_DN20799_c0_g1_i1.p1  ORF type:complete len:396 (+),score=51.86 TRINITY_DN20799_c0_g1_i1:49-1236(+)
MCIRDSLINDPVGCTVFMKYLMQERSAENLQFYIAVHKFKRGQGDLLVAANKIYTKYVTDKAKKQINIPSHIRKTLEQKLGEDLDPTEVIELYDEAQQHCLLNMAMDIFPRFITSPYYHRYINRQSTQLMAPISPRKAFAEQFSQKKPSKSPKTPSEIALIWCQTSALSLAIAQEIIRLIHKFDSSTVSSALLIAVSLVMSNSYFRTVYGLHVILDTFWVSQKSKKGIIEFLAVCTELMKMYPQSFGFKVELLNVIQSRYSVPSDQSVSEPDFWEHLNNSSDWLVDTFLFDKLAGAKVHKRKAIRWNESAEELRNLKSEEINGSDQLDKLYKRVKDLQSKYSKSQAAQKVKRKKLAANRKELQALQKQNRYLKAQLRSQSAMGSSSRKYKRKEHV